MARYGMLLGPGWGLVYHSHSVSDQSTCRTKTTAIMKIKTETKAFAAFQALEIKAKQQLSIKGGGDGEPNGSIGEGKGGIGADDIIIL